MELNHITERIIGCAIKVHSALGPGLLESTYEVCLTHELVKAGLKVAAQVALPVVYDGVSSTQVTGSILLSKMRLLLN